MGIRNYSNTGQTSTLVSAIGATDTTISLANYAGDPSPPFTASLARGTASEEVILVTGVSGSTVTVTRGYDGTNAQAQGAGATFQEVVVAQDYREANAHVNATTAGAHGTTSQLVGVSDTQTLTNKTLTAPTLANPNLTGTATAATLNATTLSVSGATSLGQTSVSTLSASGASTLAAVTASGVITANGGVTVPTGVKATLTDAPAATTDAANKAYVDGKTWPSSAISDASSTGSGGKVVKWDANGRIQPVDPAASSDAATKNYVDTNTSKLVGYQYGTVAASSPTDTTYAKVAGLAGSYPLTAGRRYRVTAAGRLNSAAAGTRPSWVVRVASGASTAVSSPAVVSVRGYMVVAGGPGQYDMTASGDFQVGTTGTFAIESWLANSNGGGSASGAAAAILGDDRGRYDVVIEDRGPVGSVTGLITI